jgi:hypothetical protein
MKHAISKEARTWLGWPSIQKASLMLVERIGYARGVAARARSDERLAA